MNKRSLRILGFYQVQNMLVRLAPSRMSKEIARRLKPVCEAEEVARSLNDTEEAYRCLQSEASVPMGGIVDIRPALEKARRDVTLEGQDCIDIWNNVRRYGDIRQYFMDKGEEYPQLAEKAEGIGDFSLISHKMAGVFDQNHQIRDNASPELMRLRNRIVELERQTKRYVTGVLQNKEYQKYFQDALVTVRNNRYVVPIKQEYRHAFPGIVHDTSASGSTLYIEPLAIVNANNDLQAARIGETKEIERIFRRLTALVSGQYEDLMDSTKCVATLEFTFAKAQLAQQMKACRPAVSQKGIVRLVQARHPLIDAKAVVPNTIVLGGEYRILLITGSNTGGKTVSMKTLGLLVLMHQAGLFIPVGEDSELPIFRDVFSDIGDEQDISQNLSTFSSHMKQIVYILRHCTADDLILADELGSGTDPAEGSAIAIAVLDALYRKGSYVMVTTHYNDLKNYAYNTPGIENGHVEFDEETLRPTYKLRIGAAGSSHAFSISERLGMPAEILAKAKELRSKAQDVDMEAILTKLNSQSKRMDEEQAELEQKLADVRRIEDELRREKEKVSAKRQDIIDSSRREAFDLKRNLRVEAERIIRELKQQSKDSSDKEKAKAIDQARRAIQQISLPDKEKPRRDPVDPSQLKVGQSVFINSLDGLGTVTEINGKKLTVSVRGMTVRVKLQDVSAPYLDEIKREEQAERKASASSSFRPIRTASVATELNIIGKTYQEALPDVEKFLDQALAAGFSPVRIIHGKGSGALRRQIHEFLDSQPFVKKYALDDVEGGGAGVTLVYF
ncbi:endonuclease MutS2 [Megasphaera stantonii]|uniref:Endonuclease MutS2 n=1 Tax=Megasphaera stantonii TaxID=2144175 RepID=A0A346B1Q8_9FIRM|nr:endonuclease MutS2 [Megasphaera stantonii]AXL22051.1 endonuclease MutS2 [Megasphaera stantonii]